MHEELIQNSSLYQLKEKWNIPIEFNATQNTFNILKNGKIAVQYDFFEGKELQKLLEVFGNELQKKIAKVKENILKLEKKYPQYIKIKTNDTFIVEDETVKLKWSFSKENEKELGCYLYLHNQYIEDGYEPVTDDFENFSEKTFYDVILEILFNNKIKKIYQQTNKELFSEWKSRVYLFVEHVGENDVLIVIKDKDRPVLNDTLLDKTGKIDDIVIESEKILTRLFKQKRLERLFS